MLRRSQLIVLLVALAGLTAGIVGIAGPLLNIDPAHLRVRANEVAISPDSRLLAIATEHGVDIRRVADHTAVATLAGPANSVAWSHSGQLVAVGMKDDASIQVYRVPSFSPYTSLRGHSRTVTALAFSPDDRTLVSGSPDGHVFLWSLASASPEPAPRSLADLSAKVSGVSWSPDGRYIAAALADSTVKVWHADTTVLAQTLQHAGTVYSVAFSPDGTLLASAGEDTTVQIWRVADWQRALVFTGHRAPVYALAWGADGQTVFSAGGKLVEGQPAVDLAIRQWRVADGTQLHQWSPFTTPVYTLATSADGRSIAAGSFFANRTALVALR